MEALVVNIIVIIDESGGVREGVHMNTSTNMGIFNVMRFSMIILP